MKKLIRDGKVAVVYSPGYGAGWSSWHRDHADELLFDRDLALAVLHCDTSGIQAVIGRKFSKWIIERHPILKVEWVPEGELFDVIEYDGKETIVLVSQQKHYKA